MKRVIIKTIALVLLVTFFFNSYCYGLATLPASQNPIVKREILAALQRTQVRYAESEDAIRLLNTNNASCLLLSSGMYLVTKEVAQNDLSLLRAIMHEDIEAIMQILGKEDRYRYQGIKGLVLKYFPPDRDNKLPIELYVNQAIARAFEWLLLGEGGIIFKDEIQPQELSFINAIKPIIMANKHNYFTAEFWDSKVRKDSIRKSLSAGMVFYQVANRMDKRNDSDDMAEVANKRYDEIINQEPKDIYEPSAWTVTGPIRIEKIIETANPTVFSSDMSKAITGYLNGTARIWMVKTGKTIAKLKGHKMGDIPIRVGISPDGKRAITADGDGMVKFWDAETGKRLFKVKAHKHNVRSVGFSLDGKKAITRGDSIKIWDIVSKTHSTINLKSEVMSNTLKIVALSPHGKRVVIGYKGGIAVIYNAKTGEHLVALKGHRDDILAVNFSYDGKKVITGSHDRTAMIWDADTGKSLAVLSTGHDNAISDVAFSPDGNMAATAAWYTAIRVWDAKTGKNIASVKGDKDVTHFLGFSQDGKKVVSANADDTAIFLDISNLASRYQSKSTLNNPVAPLPTASTDVVANIADTASNPKPATSSPRVEVANQARQMTLYTAESVLSDANRFPEAESAAILLSDLLYTQLHEDRTYEIKYDISKLSQSQIDIIETYIRLLKKRTLTPDNIKSRPFSSERGSQESMIAVYCRGKDFEGEGHVDVAIQEGVIQDYLLKIAGMLNIAFASSNIPGNLSKEDIDKYRSLISYIKNQYESILGEELAIPYSPEDILKVVRWIMLGLPKSMRTDLNQIEEYNRLAKEALIAA